MILEREGPGLLPDKLGFSGLGLELDSDPELELVLEFELELDSPELAFVAYRASPLAGAALTAALPLPFHVDLRVAVG
jgi:hypothetical protein